MQAEYCWDSPYSPDCPARKYTSKVSYVYTHNFIPPKFCTISTHMIVHTWWGEGVALRLMCMEGIPVKAVKVICSVYLHVYTCVCSMKLCMCIIMNNEQCVVNVWDVLCVFNRTVVEGRWS